MKLHGYVVLTRNTTGRHYGKTCHLTLKLVESGRRRSVLDGIRTYGCGRTYHGSHLLCRTVTYYDCILKSLCVQRKLTVDYGLTVHSNFNRKITY